MKGFFRQLSQKSLMKSPDTHTQHAAKQPRYSQDEAIYAFMSAQHERLGQFSPAHALPECCCAHIAEFSEDPAERVNNAKTDANKLIRLITRSSKKPGIQRAAADAITEIVFERPLSEVPTYQSYIDARNQCIRESQRGLDLRRPLLAAGAVEAVTELLVEGMNSKKLATVQSAAMALTTLTTDVERNHIVQSAISKSNTIELCLKCIEYAVTEKDAHSIIYLVHPLGSLTYDDSGNVPESVEVRSQIVKAGGVGPLVRALSVVHDKDGQYLIALLLGNLACDSQNKEIILRSGAVRAVLASMRLHAADQRVQDNSINLLRNLSVQHATALRQMYHQGALEVLKSAVSSGGDGHTVGRGYQELASNLIDRMEVYRREADLMQEQERRQQEQLARVGMDIDTPGVLATGQ